MLGYDVAVRLCIAYTFTLLYSVRMLFLLFNFNKLYEFGILLVSRVLSVFLTAVHIFRLLFHQNRRSCGNSLIQTNSHFYPRLRFEFELHESIQKVIKKKHWCTHMQTFTQHDCIVYITFNYSQLIVTYWNLCERWIVECIDRHPSLIELFILMTHHHHSIVTSSHHWLLYNVYPQS